MPRAYTGARRAARGNRAATPECRHGGRRNRSRAERDECTEAGERRARGGNDRKRPVGEPTRQASHSLVGLSGSGDGDGLTGVFVDRPKSGRVIPVGYTSISGRGLVQSRVTTGGRASRAAG